MAVLIASPSRLRFWIAALLVALLMAGALYAAAGEKPVKRDYRAVFAPPAPRAP